MKILVLDDNETRLRLFRQKFIGHEILCVRTVKEAIKTLKKEGFDAVFLDHDLGGKENVASGPETGYEVAYWLSKHPEKKPPQIVIHSFNTVGSRNMHALIPEATIAPGCWISSS